MPNLTQEGRIVRQAVLGNVFGFDANDDPWLVRWIYRFASADPSWGPIGWSPVGPESMLGPDASNHLNEPPGFVIQGDLVNGGVTLLDTSSSASGNGPFYGGSSYRQLVTFDVEYDDVPEGAVLESRTMSFVSDGDVQFVNGSNQGLISTDSQNSRRPMLGSDEFAGRWTVTENDGVADGPWLLSDDTFPGPVSRFFGDVRVQRTYYVIPPPLEGALLAVVNGYDVTLTLPFEAPQYTTGGPYVFEFGDDSFASYQYDPTRSADRTLPAGTYTGRCTYQLATEEFGRVYSVSYVVTDEAPSTITGGLLGDRRHFRTPHGDIFVHPPAPPVFGGGPGSAN
jgi:hypothetical protein